MFCCDAMALTPNLVHGVVVVVVCVGAGADVDEAVVVG